MRQNRRRSLRRNQVQNGCELVRSQGMIPAMTQRYMQWRGKALQSTIRANDWTGSFTSFTKSFRLFLQSAILGFGAYYVLRAEMTPGAMIAGSILLGRALAPVEQLLGQWPVLQRARPVGKAWAGIWPKCRNQYRAQPCRSHRRILLCGAHRPAPGGKCSHVAEHQLRSETG
jgi:ABC-type protease/lipase transport system fused ATPase/permease subunit